jgi:hypothetical protein
MTNGVRFHRQPSWISKNTGTDSTEKTSSIIDVIGFSFFGSRLSYVVKPDEAVSLTDNTLVIQNKIQKNSGQCVL